MEKHRPVLANSSSCGALNTKNWTKREGTTTSPSRATQWTPTPTSQHHLLWSNLLSAARFLKIADSSGWGRMTSPVHDWTLLSIPGHCSYLGRRFPNAVFHVRTPNPTGSQKFRFSSAKRLGLLRARFVSAQQRFGSTCNFKPSEAKPAWELHGKTARSWIKWMLKNRKGKKWWRRRRGGNCWWLLFKEGNNSSEARTGADRIKG